MCARDGEPAQHAVHRLVDAVGRAFQVLRDPRTLFVQQHRVLGRTGEDASFLEADDEEMGAIGVARLRQAARVEMAWPRAFRCDRERLYALPYEAQRFGERTGEVTKRVQFGDIFRERRCSAMVQRVAARRALFEECQYGVHDDPQRNGSVLCGRRDGVHQRGEPRADVPRLLRPLLGVGAVIVGRIEIRGPRLVVLDQPRERQSVRGAPPAGFRPRERARGLARSESFLFLDADVAGLQQTPEVARRKVGLDPVTEADQPASWSRERGGNARTERRRAQRSEPDRDDSEP